MTEQARGLKESNSHYSSAKHEAKTTNIRLETNAGGSQREPNPMQIVNLKEHFYQSRAVLLSCSVFSH